MYQNAWSYLSSLQLALHCAPCPGFSPGSVKAHQYLIVAEWWLHTRHGAQPLVWWHGAMIAAHFGPQEPLWLSFPHLQTGRQMAKVCVKLWSVFPWYSLTQKKVAPETETSMGWWGSIGFFKALFLQSLKEYHYRKRTWYLWIWKVQ